MHLQDPLLSSIGRHQRNRSAVVTFLSESESEYTLKYVVPLIGLNILTLAKEQLILPDDAVIHSKSRGTMEVYYGELQTI